MKKFCARLWIVTVLAVFIMPLNIIWAEQTADKIDQTTSDNVQLDIMLVLDNSGSMKKNDPEFLTPKVVKNFIGQLKAGARMGMIIFDQEAQLIEPLAAIDQPKIKTQFLESLNQVIYKGQWTNSPAGIERAVYELKSKGRPDAEKVIFFLTDGIVDTGDKSQDRVKKKWLTENLTLDASKFNIRIFAIAFTENADFSLIQTLAIKTNGEYYRAYQAEKIASVFQSINDLLIKPFDIPDKESASVSESKPFQKPPTPEPEKTLLKETKLPLPIVIAEGIL